MLAPVTRLNYNSKFRMTFIGHENKLNKIKKIMKNINPKEKLFVNYDLEDNFGEV